MNLARVILNIVTVFVVCHLPRAVLVRKAIINQNVFVSFGPLYFILGAFGNQVV